MRGKIIQLLILLAVAIAAVLAIHMTRSHQVGEKRIVAALPADFTPTFTVPVDLNESLDIGILGESRSDGSTDQMINTVVVAQLLEVLKIRQVKAVFFTGNLVSGVEKPGIEVSAQVHQQSLEHQLKQFFELYQSALGKAPFFPEIGDREIAIPGVVGKFVAQFNLKGVQVMDNALAYTVSIGPALFAVIPTDKMISGKQAEGTFSQAMLEWLRGVLSNAAATHKYLFVIGHEPAFPSTSTFVRHNMPQRDAFWKILADNHVLAYFTSREHLYDRSNRNGVWQIISGGGGAPLSQGGGSHPFFHCLLLTIPAAKKGDPKVQVLDVEGRVMDEFELKAQHEPLYQMRIS